MHRIHGGFTAAFPIKEDEKDVRSLTVLLDLLKDNVHPYTTNFEDADTTLFVSCVILPEQVYRKSNKECSKATSLPPTFILATTYCGPLKAHLYDLIAKNKNTLCKILMFCEGFTGGHNASCWYIYTFLKKHSYHSNFNSRYNYISKQDTIQEKALRAEIEEYLDNAQALGAFENLKAFEVRKLIQQHIITRGDKFAWALRPFRKNCRELLETWRVNITVALLILAGLALLFALLAPPILAITAIIRAKFDLTFYLYLLGCTPLVFLISVLKNLRRIQSKTAHRPHDDKIRQLQATQLNPVINEMTATAPLKPGFLRPFLYSSALRVLGLIGPVKLKIPTVSNIRWLVIDKKKRLLFISSFSNTTDFYVRDFLISSTASGVNFMFSHGEGFPDSSITYQEGIMADPEGYMHAVHTGQQVTRFWYAHEKNLTSDIINKNRKIRNGLFKRMTKREAEKWLKLL